MITPDQGAAPSKSTAPDGRPAPASPLPDKPSIAVLPFQNVSGDPEQEYLADGIVEDIVAGLSRIKWLFVIARDSCLTYKGRPVDLQQVGRELGVRYVLNGSVRRSGSRLRIGAQLSDATTRLQVWTQRFDVELTDFFSVQDEIAEERYRRDRTGAFRGGAPAL